MNEKEIFLKVEEWLLKSLDIAIITVIQTWGSSPRPVGSSMIVNSNHETLGSVSGGCIESFVFAKSLEVIKNNNYQILEFGVSNSQAWEVGLTCGGKIKVLVEKFTLKDLDIVKEINNIFKNQGSLILATNLSTGSRRVVNNYTNIKDNPLQKANNEISSVHNIEGISWFYKVFSSQHRIIIIGAVHISEPLVELANVLNFKTYLIDPRNNFDKNKFSNKAILLNEWPDEGLKKLGIDTKTCIVTLTHDPKLDDPALIYSLKSNALYIGCLGSKKTHEARLKRMMKNGFSKNQLSKIKGPVGININAKTPAEIACSIISQIIERKNFNDF